MEIYSWTICYHVLLGRGDPCEELCAAEELHGRQKIYFCGQKRIQLSFASYLVAFSQPSKAFDVRGQCCVDRMNRFWLQNGGFEFCVIIWTILWNYCWVILGWFSYCDHGNNLQPRCFVDGRKMSTKKCVEFQSKILIFFFNFSCIAIHCDSRLWPSDQYQQLAIHCPSFHPWVLSFNYTLLHTF